MSPLGNPPHQPLAVLNQPRPLGIRLINQALGPPTLPHLPTLTRIPGINLLAVSLSGLHPALQVARKQRTLLFPALDLVMERCPGLPSPLEIFLDSAAWVIQAHHQWSRGLPKATLAHPSRPLPGKPSHPPTYLSRPLSNNPKQHLLSSHPTWWQETALSTTEKLMESFAKYHFTLIITKLFPRKCDLSPHLRCQVIPHLLQKAPQSANKLPRSQRLLTPTRSIAILITRHTRLQRSFLPLTSNPRKIR